MRKELEFLLDNVDLGEHLEQKTEEVERTLLQRNGPYIRWLDELQDDTKLVLPDPSLTEIPTMSRVLNDYESGIALLGAPPNSGKSTLIVNMITQSLDLNEDLVVIDLSLDDPYKKRIIQYLASMTGLNYQQLYSPQTLSQAQKVRKDRALQGIRSHVSRGALNMFEGSETFKIEGKTHFVVIREFSKIFKLLAYYRKKYPDKKIACFIDAWNNLDFSKESGVSELAKQETAVNKLHDISREENVMVFMTAHLRKTQEKIRSLEDIKGTALLLHAAVWAGRLINEYRENLHTEPLLYKEGDFYYPVIIVEVQKTKVSSWEQPLFYGLKSGECGIVPFDRNTYADYHSQLRGRS